MGTTARFIDIGANLLDEVYSGKYHGGSQKHEPDLEAVLERASKAGVEKVIGSTCYVQLDLSSDSCFVGFTADLQYSSAAHVFARSQCFKYSVFCFEDLPCM